jgi:3'-phosphoadenosine 5'-phosphosulfate sulfotransferase (PAPS reductase)/FAD synthetase
LREAVFIALKGLLPMRDIFLPAVIGQAIAYGAEMWFSESGGKDGQAMLEAYKYLCNRQEWPTGASRTAVVHADLKSAEWPQSKPHVQHLSTQAGLKCVIVGRKAGDGDLTVRIAERKSRLVGTGQPFWPSPAQRYCTSDTKRSPINAQLVRANIPLVISAEGIRAQESEERAAKSPLSVRKEITSVLFRHLSPEDALAQWIAYYATPRTEKQHPRLAFTWYPLVCWTQDDVWEVCGASQQELDQRRAFYRAGEASEQADPEKAEALKTQALAGWPLHPCYVFGNERCSCALCLVYGSLGDLRVGARHKPQVYRLYQSWEDETGITFRKGLSLKDVVEGNVPGSTFCGGCQGCVV